MEEYVKTKLFVTITDKDRTERIVKLFKRYNINYSCSINAKGTASSSLLSYFGLDDVKKNVILSVVPCILENKLMYLLHNKLEIYKPGNGICFSLGITSANRYLSSIYSNFSNHKEEYIMENQKQLK